MNDPDESFVQLCWWIQEIIPHIAIHSILHKKSMILTRVLFNYSDEFKKLSHTFRFLAHYIRNKGFWSEFCSTILIDSRNYPRRRDSWHIIYEINDFQKCSVQLFWWIQEIIPHIEINSTLYKKWMILTRVLLNYWDQLKKLSHTFRFIAHYIRNEWFWKQFCSTILVNWKKLSRTLRFIAHYISNEWFWTVLCLTFLMVLWQYSIYKEMWEIGWKGS